MANRSPEPIGDFIRRTRLEKGLSLADVSKQSARFGKGITASYINRIETDPTRRPTADRLKALALGLGVPVEELVTRAVGVAPRGDEADELHLLTRFRELSPQRKADVLKLIALWHSDESSRRTRRRGTRRRRSA